MLILYSSRASKSIVTCPLFGAPWRELVEARLEKKQDLKLREKKNKKNLQKGLLFLLCLFMLILMLDYIYVYV